MDDKDTCTPTSCDSCNHTFTPSPENKRGLRVTLTRAEMKMPEIQELAELLVKIASDGALEYEELQALTEWLNNHNRLEIAGVKYLIDVMLQICADGVISEQEVWEVQLAIERVLPKEFRSQIIEARKAQYYSQPATAAQLDLIEKLTNSRPADLTRRQASEILDGVFNATTNRQIMFLRFWDKEELASNGRHEVSAWMDAFIEDDPARWAAWTIFKAESGDDGSQRDPSCVPVGIGPKYLVKVSASREELLRYQFQRREWWRHNAWRE